MVAPKFLELARVKARSSERMETRFLTGRDRTVSVRERPHQVGEGRTS